MADRRNAVIMAHYTKATRIPDEYVKYAIDETDLTTWYVLLHNFTGNNDEFKNGEYLVKIVIPEKYPFEPVQFFFITHNGVYDVDKKVCIHIGEYHKDKYSATMGVAGFVANLVSGMIGWRDLGSGINILKTSAEEKQQLAAKSQAYNKLRAKHVLEHIDECYAAYSVQWAPKTAVSPPPVTPAPPPPSEQKAADSADAAKPNVTDH